MDLGFNDKLNQSMTKLLFTFSLFITYLFIFIFFNLVDLVYVYSKCLDIIMILCLLVNLIHVRLDFLL